MATKIRNNRLMKVELSGFKSIQSLDLPLKDINVLIGANGSGKSNFIQFFRLLNFLCTQNLQGFVQNAGGANSLLHFGAQTTSQIQGAVHFSTTKGENRYQIELTHGARDNLYFSNEAISFCQANKPWDTAPVHVLGTGHLESFLASAHTDAQGNKIPPKTAPTILKIMRDWRVFQFHDTSQAAKIKQSGYAQDHRYLRPDGGNLAAFLWSLRETSPDSYQEIVATIQRALPSFKDFVLEPHPISQAVMLNWLHRDGGDMVFGPHQISDGSLRFMALCTLLLQPKLPSLILLDEPELGLHPYAIEVLAGLLRSTSADCQLIISTQSITLANQFEPEDVVVLNERQGISVLERKSRQGLEQWLTEYRIGDLWAKNMIGGTPE